MTAVLFCGQPEDRKYIQYTTAQLLRYQVENGMYYYAEGGKILALDLSNGFTIWENIEFQALPSIMSWMKAAPYYVCSYYGPICLQP